MTYKLGVLVIHGMGNQESNFANGLINEVNARMEKKGISSAQIAWQAVWWAPVLSEKQESLLRRMQEKNDLDMMKLRRFVIHSLADAVAYQQVKTAKAQINVYNEIHTIVAKAMKLLRTAIHQDFREKTKKEVPLVVIGHSLGCHIISNYIWDLQKKKGKPKSGNAFERMETLAGMYTFGCNIPMFTFAYNALKPIEFPPKTLSAHLPGLKPDQIKELAQWLNFYDPDDILGYPLKQISKEYDATVNRDIPINAGGLFTSWNPVSHTAYWEDDNLTKPLTQGIYDLLKVL